MKRITVIAMKRDRKAVLEYLQVLGAVEVLEKRREDEIFKREDMSKQRQTFLKNAERAEEALAILKKQAPEKTGLLSMFEGRRELTREEFEERLSHRDEIMRLCSEVIDLDKQYADTVSNIPKLEDQKKALEPWMNFDLPLSLSQTAKTSVFIGAIPGEYTRETLYTELKTLSGADIFDADLISSDATQTCICLVCEKKDQAQLREALRRMNFASPPVTDLNPAKRTVQIDQEIAEAQAEGERLLARFQKLGKERDKIRFASDYFTIRADKYGVISGLLQSRRVFFLEGWIPGPRAEEISSKLESKFSAAVSIRDPGAKEDPPVLLKNNGFAAPLEGITESYSLPAKGEIDPTFIASLFYYILFGIMLSDAAYGILMALGTFLILKKYGRTMEEGMKKTMKMFFLCGISTIIWGFLFGSFFGDAVAVIGTTFFGKPEGFGLKPLWFEPLSQPMRMLSFCFVLALAHMFVGLGAKAYELLRDRKVLDFIYDCGFWYGLLISVIVWLLTVPTMAGMLELSTLPSSAAGPAKVVAAVCAAGIILTGGRESKNWFKRILKGIYALYGISGWLSDVLSYSRLLALGLATGVIATVFNSMGSMGGNTPIGAVVFIIIFLIGNVLNLAINALGSYVHTNRLTYVEFFGKFYEGGGRKFAPFAQNTKYFKIKEDM